MLRVCMFIIFLTGIVRLIKNILEIINSFVPYYVLRKQTV
jgi:hypothetical protein